MKNENEPKEYFERNTLFVIVLAAISLFLDWLSVDLLMDVNPWGSATAVPGLVLTLQSLWLIVNPYAVVYEDRFEIKQSLIYNKLFYFLDAKAIDENQKGQLFLKYNDEEMEKLHLFGIKASDKKRFKIKLAERINHSLQKRDF